MQSVHQYKAAVGALPHHQPAQAHHGLEDWAGLGAGYLVFLGLPLFGAFVVYRFWRWFFRVTR